MINHLARQTIIAKWESVLSHQALNGFEALRAELRQQFVLALSQPDTPSVAAYAVYINDTIATLARTIAKDETIQLVIDSLRETRAALFAEELAQEIETADIDYQKIMRILGVSIFQRWHRHEPAQVISLLKKQLNRWEEEILLAPNWYDPRILPRRQIDELYAMRYVPFYMAVVTLGIMGFTYAFAINAHGRAEYVKYLLPQALNQFKEFCELWGGNAPGNEPLQPPHQYDILSDCCHDELTCFRDASSAANEVESLQNKLSEATLGFLLPLILVTVLLPLVMRGLYEVFKKKLAKITIEPEMSFPFSDISRNLVQILNVLHKKPKARELSRLGGGAAILRHLRNMQDFLNCVVERGVLDNEMDLAIGHSDDESHSLVRMKNRA